MTNKSVAKVLSQWHNIESHTLPGFFFSIRHCLTNYITRQTHCFRLVIVFQKRSKTVRDVIGSLKFSRKWRIKFDINIGSSSLWSEAHSLTLSFLNLIASAQEPFQFHFERMLITRLFVSIVFISIKHQIVEYFRDKLKSVTRKNWSRFNQG